MAERPPERRFFQLFMLFWLPVLLYVTGIIVLSAQPSLKPPISFRFADKVYHAAEYMILGLLLARAARATLRPVLLWPAIVAALLLGVGIASGDEIFQSTVPGRESSAYDAMADTVGVAIAQWLYARGLRRSPERG